MSRTARVELTKRCDDLKRACHGGVRGLTEVFEASFEATLRDQDAPRALSANSGLLAMTRLASPNRLNSCASFLARPL